MPHTTPHPHKQTPVADNNFAIAEPEKALRKSHNHNPAQNSREKGCDSMVQSLAIILFVDRATWVKLGSSH